MDINNVTDVRCYQTKDARRWSGNWAAQRGAWKLPLVEREHLSISQFFHTTKPKSRRGILGFEDFVRGLQRSGNLKWHRKMTCKMNNSEKVWKSMEKFNLLKVSISSCNSAVPPINVISCTGTTNLTKDWISGWRFRRQNFEFSNPARFEAFWPVACRMWIQGSSRSFPTPWPLWVSCQNVQNATFWEFQCSTPTTKTTKARLFACGRSYPTSRCQNPQAWMWWLNMWRGSGAGWEREQIVTFVFSPCQGQSLNDIDVIFAPPKVVWCKRYSEEMWFVSPQPFIRTSCERFNKLVTGGVFQATASKGALAVSWLTYWRQGLMLSWSGMWDWDWIDHLDHFDMIFKHD